MLWRAPGFTLVVVVTAALAVGANTAIFAAVYAALFRPLPYPHSDRIVFADDQAPGLFLDWRAQAKSFSAMAALKETAFVETGGDRPERMDGAVVTSGFFDVMGVRPALGRALTPADENGRQVAVIADAFWRRRFGGDPGAVGRSVVLDGKSYQVVGIMPPGFDFPGETLVWVSPRHVIPTHPLHPNEDATQVRGSHYLGAYARLAPGVTVAQAESEQRIVFERLHQRYPADVLEEDVQFPLVPLRDLLVGDIRPALLVLFAAVAMVLLIGCANIANLMLARSAARRQEITIRTALGAGRSRILAQLLTESLLLGLLGGAAGVALAAWTLPLLLAAAPSDVRALHVAIGTPVLGFALLASIAAGLLFGMAPALQATRGALAGSVSSVGRTVGGRESRRLREVLTVAEFALSLALLIGAALMIRSFLDLRRVDPGFHPAGLSTAHLVLPVSRYGTPERQAQFFDQLLEALRSAPGVQDAAAAARLPFAGGNSTRGITIDGPAPANPWGGIRVISPHYFSVMGIRLRAGRTFTDRDRAGGLPVAIVNETMARTYWPGQRALGHRFQIGDSGPWLEIVGVAHDVKHASLREQVDPEFYQPMAQAPWSFMSVVVRSTLPAESVGGALDRALRGIDPELPAPHVRPMSGLVATSMTVDRFEMLGLVLFACAALALAVVGLYGVMSYLVSRRTREIGVRMALGAAPATVLLLVLKDGLRLTAAGLVAGVALAGLATRALASVLFGVTAFDLPTYAAVAIVLTVTATVATYLPARRAMRINPIEALRTE